MNYIFDYAFKSSNTPYKYTNVNNIYNFIYDMIKLNDDDEYEKKIHVLIKKNIGITFYNNFIAYSIKKNLDIKIKI